MSTQSNCSICLESTSPLDFILLLCNHEFCKNCLIKDWTLKIKAGQISENFLNCLSNNCKVPINYYILKENLSCEIFEKYDAYCLEQYVTESKNEKSIHCPKCSKLSIIHKDSQYFNCPVCISKFCANEKCLGYWKDHEKLTCEEFQSKKNTFGQKEFDRLLLENNWKRCPKCNTPIEKIKTCNYIVCSSKLCQKKTIFCYICGELLNENQIKSHYTESNYYKLCEEKRDIQMKFEKTKENLQCPLCGVWSKENFGTITVDNKYKIYKCMSDKCKNNKFCLNCKLKVESNNDKEIKRHLNMLCVEKLRISNLSKLLFIIIFIKPF